MDQFNLGIYSGKVLRVKLKTNESILGLMEMTRTLLPSERPVNYVCRQCDFRIIDDFEKYKNGELQEKDLAIRTLNASDVESIEFVSI